MGLEYDKSRSGSRTRSTHTRQGSVPGVADGSPPGAETGKVRLQKFLSDAGVASRRHAEELILEGHVLVNDRVVDALPAFVDPGRDRVVVDGTPVRPQRLEYFMVNKPKGVVCTNRDPGGRVRVADLLPDLKSRLFPVGRLDAESTGLVLMTNDGELAQRLTHPRYGVPKTYHAEVRGRVPDDLPARLRQGIYLAEGPARADRVEVVYAGNDRSSLLITLREGRNRQIRRMLARLGHPVKKLKRISIGPLSLRGLPLGAARRLTARELAELRRVLVEPDAEGPNRAPGRGKASASHARQGADGGKRVTGRRAAGPRPDPKEPRGRRLIT